MSVLYLTCDINLNINQLINSLIYVDDDGDVGLNTFVVTDPNVVPVAECDYESWEQLFRQMIVVEDGQIKLRVYQ